MQQNIDGGRPKKERFPPSVHEKKPVARLPPFTSMPPVARL
jgi:hypothetical protein